MVIYEGPERREDRFGYELHRLVAAALHERGDEIHEIGFRNLAGMRERAGGRHRQMWLDEWERLLRGTDSELIAGMLQLSQLGNDLRSITPFAGVLTRSQRLEALRKARGG